MNQLNTRVRARCTNIWGAPTAAILLAAIILAGASEALAGGAGPVFTRKKQTDNSSAVLNVDDAHLLFDNDLAFRTKLQAVQGASESIRVAYYIYHDDYTSSLFTKALIDAARRGVKVRVLLDYFYNYRHLDMFTMMEREGGGNLEVRFFNRPTKNIIRDAVYMTTPCPAQGDCQRAKEKVVAQIFAGASKENISTYNSGYSGLFLSGYYSKDPRAVKMALTEGGGVDFSKLASGAAGANSPAQREQLKKLGKIYWTSKTGDAMDRTWANIQLSFAMFFFGDQLRPLLKGFAGILPVEGKRDDKSNQDWVHLTDFLHHKILLADGKDAQGKSNFTLQVGGRNIEDAYSMNPNDSLEKYVFWDTDLRAQISGGADAVKQSFDELFDFREMVASLEEVRLQAPNDFTANNDLVGQRCREKSRLAGPQADTKMAADPVDDLVPANLSAGDEARVRAELRACVAEESNKTPLGLDERVALQRQRTIDRAREYVQRFPKYVTGQSLFADLPGSLRLPEADRGEMLATYIENLPYNRETPPAKRQRIYGARDEKLKASGKEYHVNWIRSMWRTCEASALDGQERSIYLHNAYFFPGSNLLNAVREMYDGRRDCSKVTLKVITNSAESTDLRIVNAFARHAMRAFLEHYDKYKKSSRAVRIEYFEYKAVPSAVTLAEGKKVHVSLHSKTSLIGDDLIVGSANADVRSYFMDTNNAIYLRYVPKLAAEYRAYLDKILADPSRVTDMKAYFRAHSHAEMLKQNRAEMEAFFAAPGWGQKVSPKMQVVILNTLTELYDRSYKHAAAAMRGSRRASEEFNSLFQGI